MPNAISTQVIDGAYGTDATGMSVRLLAQTIDGTWAETARGRTGAEGGLLVWPMKSFEHIAYRLEYDLADYFTSLGSSGLLSRVIVEFRPADQVSEMHLPLLVAPGCAVVYHGPRIAAEWHQA